MNKKESHQGKARELNPFIFGVSHGLGGYAVQLAKGLARKRPVVAALDGRDDAELRDFFPDYFLNPALRTVAVRIYRIFDPRRIIQIFRTYNLINRNYPDVIHIMLGGIVPELLPGLWLASKTGRTLVATVHDAWFHPGDLPPLYEVWVWHQVRELCTQLIVHGRQLAETLINKFGIDERIINIIPHGNYDIYLYARGANPRAIPEPGRVLLFGRMKKYKGLEVLAKAAPLVADRVPNLKIVLAGKGEELDRLEPQLRSNPIFEIRNDWISAAEAADVFASSSLVVIPYLEASQSGPLHLAYTWGRPVVATRVGAIPESLGHGREGLLVPPNDPEALAEAMIKILNDPALATELGRAARLKAETELSWSGEISEKTTKVYEKAIALHKSRQFYPGIGARARWKIIKELYRRSKMNE